MSITTELLSAPRNSLSRLSKRKFQDLSTAQQRLIIILEQIAHIKGINESQRDLSTALQIPQPSVQGYLAGETGDPLRIKSDRFKKIAEGRGITEDTLRKFLAGETDVEAPRNWNQFLEMAQLAPLDILAEVLPIIRKRIQTGIEAGTLAGIADHLNNLPSISSTLSTSTPDLNGNEVEEDEVEVEPEPEPEPEPHPGNLRLLEALQAKQKEMGLSDERFTQFMEFFLEEMTPDELLLLLSESVDPVPNKLVSGPLPKILSLPAKKVYEIRDGVKEAGGEEEPEEKNPPAKSNSSPSPSNLKVRKARK